MDPKRPTSMCLSSCWQIRLVSFVSTLRKYSIANIELPEGLSEADHSDREGLRQFLSRKFENDRKSQAAQNVELCGHEEGQ